MAKLFPTHRGAFSTKGRSSTDDPETEGQMIPKHTEVGWTNVEYANMQSLAIKVKPTYLLLPAQITHTRICLDTFSRSSSLG